jgi:hypothetical protein
MSYKASIQRIQRFLAEQKLRKQMTPIFYRHFQDIGRTIAVAAPTRQELNQALTLMKKGHAPTFELTLGIARLHPKDKYSKQAGRETALKNVTFETATLTGVNYDLKGVFYHTQVNDHTFTFWRTYKKKHARLYAVYPTDAL